MHVDLDALRDSLEEVLVSHASSMGGAVVAVGVGDEEIALAHGSANLNTGQLFTTDTGWLLGSVTKVLTTVMVLRLAERGEVDLDAAVTDYLPDFRLATEGLAKQISVRMLLNHTNGIDADVLFPDGVRGQDAGRSYQAALARAGVAFEPGKGVHYSNPGFVLASRIAEEVTGLPFEQAIAAEVFGPCGMADATAVQTQAFLRRTAIGAFPGPDGTLRATKVFTLPESGGGCGSTPIVTVADMLAFGRTHLRSGVSPASERVLSAETVKRMQTVTADLGIPSCPPVGLGWMLIPVAGTVVGWHGGGSPGGSSSFCILPEHDTVIVSFVSGIVPGAALNERLHTTAIRHITGNEIEQPALPEPPLPEAQSGELAGTYVSFMHRIEVEPRDGDALVLRREWEFDEEHRRIYEGFLGSVDAFTSPPITLRPVAPRIYAPDGMALEAFTGVSARSGLFTFLPAAEGRPAGLHNGGRFTPKVM